MAICISGGEGRYLSNFVSSIYEDYSPWYAAQNVTNILNVLSNIVRLGAAGTCMIPWISARTESFTL